MATGSRAYSDGSSWTYDNSLKDNNVNVSDSDYMFNVNFSSIAKFSKRTILVVLWIITVIMLSSNKPGALDLPPRLIVVAPSVPKKLDVPIKYRKIVGVTLIGPFVPVEEFGQLAEEVTQHLMVQMQRVFLNNDGPIVTLNISEMWTLTLPGYDATPEYLKPIQKTHIFAIFENVSYDNATRDKIVLQTDIKEPIAVKLFFDRTPNDTTQALIYGCMLFIMLYMHIIWDITERTFAAILCSILAIAVLTFFNPRPSMQKLMQWIHIELLFMLFNLMVLVTVLIDTGILYYIARRAYEFSKGNIWTLINLLSILIAGFSAVLDNLTIMLIVTPVVIHLCELLTLDPEIVLTFMLMYANIGATATNVGAPSNILIFTHDFVAKSKGVNFGSYIIHVGPCTLIVLVVTYFQLHRKFKVVKDFQFHSATNLHNEKNSIRKWRRIATSLQLRDDTLMNQLMRAMLKKTAENRRVQLNPLTYYEVLTMLRTQYTIKSRWAVVKAVVALVFLITFYIWAIAQQLNDDRELCWITFKMAILLCIFNFDQVQTIIDRVEWPTLIFIASIFILIEVLTQLGLLQLMGEAVADFLLVVHPSFRLMVAILIVIWITALGSCLLCHIPMVMMMLKIIISLAIHPELDLPFQPLVWSLAMGASFAGNGALLASAANIVTMGITERNAYKFHFFKFSRIGFPIMCQSTAIASIYLIIAHCIFEWHDPPIKLNMN